MKKVRVKFSLEDMDMSEFQNGATYTQIKDYVLEHIDWGSWGGAFSKDKKASIRSMSAVKNEKDYDPYYMYGDCAEKESSVSRWAEAYQNDFLARMIWSVTDLYENANHHPHAVLNQDTTMDILSNRIFMTTENE